MKPPPKSVYKKELHQPRPGHCSQLYLLEYRKRCCEGSLSLSLARRACATRLLNEKTFSIDINNLQVFLKWIPMPNNLSFSVEDDAVPVKYKAVIASYLVDEGQGALMTDSDLRQHS